jgi:CRP-like cAMP-binding protein
MVLETVLNILSTADIFKSLTKSDIEILGDHCTLIKCNKGELVVEEEQEMVALFFILRGRFDVFLPEQNSNNIKRHNSIKLNTLTEGDCFGEYSLIDKGSISASVVAIESSEVIKITKSGFESFVNSDDRIARIVYYNLLKKLTNRIRFKDKELDMFVF